MTQRKNGSFFTLIAILVAMIFVSGCNRGYGCPAELNVFEFLINLF